MLIRLFFKREPKDHAHKYTCPWLHMYLAFKCKAHSQGKMILSHTSDKKPFGHTQQNDEKHIPTYNHGTRTPDMSLPS